MAVALTPFEALCGFRPLNEIADHMQTYPELVELIGQEVADDFLKTVQQDTQDIDHNKTVLKRVFSSVMHSSQERVTAHLTKLIDRLQQTQAQDTMSQLLIRLDQQYPGGDVGVFSSLLLNYVTMQPGQAIFLGANEPHAYLSGGNYIFKKKKKIAKGN